MTLERRKATKEEIETAKRTYSSVDIEIDPDAEVAISDGGIWVAAWVWIEK